MSATVSGDLIDRRVDELIINQARRTPDRLAVMCAGHRLTYGELDQRTATLAARLGGLIDGPDTVVGVHLERSVEMLIAVIAIMRAGAAYLPLDPDFPAERLAFMVSDSGLKGIVSQSSLKERAPPGDYTRLDIDRDLSDAAGGLSGAGGLQPAGGTGTGKAAIYMLYTSGSTGQPKGVVLEHRNVVNFLLSMQQEPGLVEGDRLLAVTTLSFDIAVLELFLPLITGATVIIAEREDTTDGERLKWLAAENEVTIMQATPISWRLMLEAGWQPAPGFKILVGGEALPADLARALAAACPEVWNMYGPTETAIWSTCYRLPPQGAPILIGKPIANTRVYILDKSGRPVPSGVPGEIFIAGDGVARGYHNRDQLNAERFLPDPFVGTPGASMYRTGDLGRMIAGGQLEFRQRADNQVKVRGFRVELAEVEAALADIASIKQAVCAVAEVRPGDARLVGYIQPVGDNSPSAADLKEALGRRLPLYMVPQHFIVVDAFPLTPNGKIDRRQLPKLEDVGAIEDPYVAPSTPTEVAVANVFGDVLQLEKVSVTAGFFDLGGHSILATRALAMLRRSLLPGLALRTLFEQSSVRALAASIDAALAGAVSSSQAAASAAETEELQF